MSGTSLPLWHDDNILDLLNEGCSIQHCLQTNKGERSNSEDTARKFANLMFQGKVKAALRFVSDKSHGSFLPISAQVGESTVLEELIKKHPSPSPASSSSLIVTDSTNLVIVILSYLTVLMTMSYGRLYCEWRALLGHQGWIPEASAASVHHFTQYQWTYAVLWPWLLGGFVILLWISPLCNLYSTVTLYCPG